MLTTSFIDVWFGNDHWNGVEWTLSVELWGSFLVYLVLITLYNYKNRYTLYIGLIAFFILAQVIGEIDYKRPGNLSQKF